MSVQEGHEGVSAVRLWAAKLDERKGIENFLDWVADHPEHAAVLTEAGDICAPVAQLLDEYHGIDRLQLEDERRKLLEQQRELNE